MKVIKDTPFEVAWIPTTFREGKTVLTMLVKATFDIPSQGPCIIAEDQQLLTGDIYFEDDVGRKTLAELLGQSITPDTKFIWFPKNAKPKRQDVHTMKVINES